MASFETKTGGREATGAVVPGRFALSIGRTTLPEPPGFNWHPLSDLARLESGHTPSRSHAEYWDGGIPWVGIRDATANHGIVINDTNQYVTELGLLNSSARMLPAGTVCLSRTASVGYVVIMGVSMATSQDFVNWVCGPDLSPSYLRYLLVAEQESVRRFAYGTTHQTMYFPEAKALQVLIPVRSEQDAIAGILGAIDEKIAANTQVSATASALAGLVYDRAVASSPTCTMSHVLTPILGGTPSRSDGDYWGGANLWASAKDVTGSTSGVIVDTVEKISDLAISATKAKPLPVGSVIITARGTVGAVARLAKPSSFNQSCYGFAPGALPAGVLYFSIVRATERAKAIAHGSVFDTITMKTFDHLTLPEINSAEVSRLEALLAPLLDTVTSTVTQTASLATIRDALLPQLMSGKLRVKDAEKVLERVL